MYLQMEQVLELGEGISNGRVWDVRLAKKRKRSNSVSPIQAALDRKKPTQEAVDANEQDTVDSEPGSFQKAESDPRGDEDSVMVCRPKVGKMTIGGGFIGIWRKMAPST
jgi:hypothetical protein